jgi:hypothetical protein
MRSWEIEESVEAADRLIIQSINYDQAGGFGPAPDHLGHDHLIKFLMVVMRGC